MKKFSMKTALVDQYDPILRTPTTPWAWWDKEQLTVEGYDQPLGAQEMYELLRVIMIVKRGLGLAANQIGIPHSVFVVGSPDDPDNIMAVFNPKIVDYSNELVTVEEGCLTFPGLYVKVSRPVSIKARFTNQKGITDTVKLTGMAARAFQHEFDHLQGKVLTDGVPKVLLDRAKNQQKKLNRQRKRNR